ncbi:hypothetical protein L226DRAFT_615535 [Lentinus tigrinus ALCF2SS1-7]|uniref:RING-type domain-containing protein n=1 Tax=Lentinus tigrinus ALCF2SS1-6 TaxID=1328759 RepID=A0A5C2RZ36_9APHY|nr:hypothetical protein L227DRAFT_602989 [Lentinus tigrinus ALCF2SS1-6]RPD71533.1 hypothetical protein L226DRAFT_615535 [Lentinus tigrinus ALCF2SS1-7]
MPVPAKCNQCKEVFRTLPDCEAHAARMGHQPHPAYFCELCPEVFTTQKQRSAHMQRAWHGTNPPPQVVAPAQPLAPPVQGISNMRYLCNNCAILLSSDAARLEHVQQTGHASFSRLTPLNEPQGDAVSQLQLSAQTPAAVASSSSSNEPAADVAAAAHSRSKETSTTRIQTPGTPSSSTMKPAQNAYCDKCKLWFDDRDALQEHFKADRSTHPHCGFCGLGFPSIINYAAHKARCPPPGTFPKGTNARDTAIPSRDTATPSNISYTGRSSQSVTTNGIAPSSTTPGSRWYPDSSIRSQADIWSTSSCGPASAYDRSEDHEHAASSAASSSGSLGGRSSVTESHPQAAASASIKDWQRRVPLAQAGSTAVNSPADTPPRSSFHCRSCLKDPCTEPVATVCGHLFCHSCILHEIETNMCCPVCQTAFLIELHIESD